MQKWCRAARHDYRLGRAIALAAAFAICCYSQAPPTSAPPAENPAHRPGASPANALDKWLDALAVAESGNRQRLVHRDRDGQLYYGCLQFHEKTFRAYVRKYHLLPKSSRTETMSRIYDCAFQKHLAALMIRDDPENWRHWKGTVEKRVGLPPTLKAASEQAGPADEFSADGAAPTR